MNDITIFYQGGSGGFTLYYYLLLSGNYQYDIPTVKQMISQQFPPTLSTDRLNWKLTELWPDNVKLKHQQGPKLFLICNPLFNPDCYAMYEAISSDTYKILLYTNLHLQLRMAYEKQAYWFTPISRQHFNAPKSIKQYIRQIIESRKDYNNIQVDPTVLDIIDKFSPSQIIRLEDFINTALINNFDRPNQDQLDFLKYWLSLQSPKAARLIKNY